MTILVVVLEYFEIILRVQNNTGRTKQSWRSITINKTTFLLLKGNQCIKNSLYNIEFYKIQRLDADTQKNTLEYCVHFNCNKIINKL